MPRPSPTRLLRFMALAALPIVAGAGGCIMPEIQIASAPAPRELPPALPPPAPASPITTAAMSTPPPPPLEPTPVVASAPAPPASEPPPAVRSSTDPSRVSVFYGLSRARLDLGICEVTIPPDHRKGTLETPRDGSAPNPFDHVVVQSVTPLDRDRFVGYLRQHVAAWTQGEAFLFAHGHGLSLDEACRRTAQRWFDAEPGGVAMLFSGPADPATAYGAARSREHHQAFIEFVVGQTGATNVHLLAREGP